MEDIILAFNLRCEYTFYCALCERNASILNSLFAASESLIKNTLQMLSLHLPIVGLWWRIAVVQSGTQSSSSHSNRCHSSSSVCSDPVPRNCGVPSKSVSDQTSQPRRKQFSRLLLLLSGDVETNPGPFPGIPYI